MNLKNIEQVYLKKVSVAEDFDFNISHSRLGINRDCVAYFKQKWIALI